MAWTFRTASDGHKEAVATIDGPAEVLARKSVKDGKWYGVGAKVKGFSVQEGRTLLSDAYQAQLEQKPAPTPTPTPTPTPKPTPTPTPSGKWPALPSGAKLERSENFESGTVGQSFTSNQCYGDLNKIVNDPYGGGMGKCWEGVSTTDRPPVAAHPSRCECGQWSEAPTNAIWRLVLAIPGDSKLPGDPGDKSGWQYRAQIHGSNPSTSPPIGVWVKKAANNKVALSFQSGDSRNLTGKGTTQAGPVDVSKDQWIYVQFGLRMLGGGKAVGSYAINGQQLPDAQLDLTKISQGAPSQVYLKFGVDGAPGKALVAQVEQWKVG